MTEYIHQLRIELPQLDLLIKELLSQRYRVVGPRVREGVIVYDDIRGLADLPLGFTDAQEKGSYRLENGPQQQDASKSCFTYAVGPDSLKKFIFPKQRRLWSAKLADGNRITEIMSDIPREKIAFIGVRACDLKALFVQDKVFDGVSKDPGYVARRQDVLMFAVDCTHPAATCFCTSFNYGPDVKEGYDLAFTEVINATAHYFVARAASKAGEEILGLLQSVSATPAECTAAQQLLDAAAAKISRRINPLSVKEILVQNPDHKAWDAIAEKCLSCANCTMVCPTCFCSTVEEKSDLEGDHVERWQRWDSCFNAEHSFIHGHVVHGSTKSRYRQWLTHKLSTWYDQFGESGCVGCGRCISWCPVGIDLTESPALFTDDVK